MSQTTPAVRTFQDLILALQQFWAEQGCVILQPYDMEMGAGTFHTATFLRAIGPETWNAAYVQPSRRPTDGRYGENPNRLQHYYQFQVVLKPNPANIQELYLESLRRIGFAFAAAVLSPLGLQTALAGKTDPCKAFCKCRNKKQQNQCLTACKACGKNTSRLAGTCGGYTCCGAGQTSCGSYCTTLANDISNCGTCGVVCDQARPYEYAVCMNGACVYPCEYGAIDCGGACTPVLWDPDNCGGCGNVCGGDTPFCYEGGCIGCPDELALCDNACIDVNWDANNCGACGNVCGAGETCCNGTCSDLANDPAHCGSCTTSCGGNESCCGGACRNTQTTTDCGACGNSCSPAATSTPPRVSGRSS